MVFTQRKEICFSSLFKKHVFLVAEMPGGFCFVHYIFAFISFFFFFCLHSEYYMFLQKVYKIPDKVFLS